MEQLLYRSIDTLSIGGSVFILRVTTDGETLTADFEQNPASGTVENLFDLEVYYGNESRIVTIGTRLSGTVTFPYDSSIRQITLNGASAVYGGTDLGTTASFSWGTGYGNPLPQSEFLPDGPETVSNIAVQCTVTAPADKYPALLGVWIYRYSGTRGWQMVQALNLEEKHGGNAWFLMVSPFSEGNQVRYRYVTAYYSSAEAALYRSSDYDAIAEEESPVYIVSDNGGYFVPYNLAWSSPTAGCPVQISWGTYLNMDGIFQLQRSVDGGAWTLIYAGESNSFTDTAGEWSTVAYRVRSYEGYGDYYSQWVTGDAVDVGRTNLYVGVNGIPTPASGIYLGRDGGIHSCIPMMHAGR